MKIKNTYPPAQPRTLQRRRLLKILRWPYLLIGTACPLTNILIGGKAWSIIVLMGMYMIWDLVLSPDLVEYNRISQATKVVIYSIIFLVLIDIFLSSGWALDVIPIVCFGGLILSGILFFTDFEHQKQNMLPMLLLIFLTIIGAAIGLMAWKTKMRWALIVMGALACLLLLACVLTLGSEFGRELKRRFHIK